MADSPKTGVFSLKAKLALSLIIILFFAQALNLMLRTYSHELLHIWGIAAKIEIFGNRFINNTEADSETIVDDSTDIVASLRHEYLELEKVVPEIKNIYIADENGIIRQTINESRIPLNEYWEKAIAGNNKIKTLFSDKNKFVKCVEIQRQAYILLTTEDFFDSDKIAQPKSVLIFQLDKSRLNREILDIQVHRLSEALILSVVAGFLLLVLLKFVPIIRNRKFLKFNIYCAVFAVFIAAQGFSLFYNSNLYSSTYITTTREIGTDINEQMLHSLKWLLNEKALPEHKAVIMNDITALDERCDEIRAINIFDANGNVIISSDSTRRYAKLDLKSPWQSNVALYSVVNGKRTISGYSNVTFNRAYIEKDIRQYFYNSLTVSVVSLLIQAELIFLVLTLFMVRIHDDELIETDRVVAYCQQIRFIVFTLIFAGYIPITFIPLYIADIYEPLFGLSEKVLQSLPLSSEICFIGVFTLIAGVLIRKIRWELIFVSGVALLTTGSICSAYATHPLEFILARGIVGAGLGCSMTAIGTFISKITTKENRASGYSNFGVGITSGTICGAVIGALLADRYDYRITFTVAASLAPLVALGFFLFKPRLDSSFSGMWDETEQSRLSISEILSFVRQKRVYSVFISWTITAAMVFGFVYFFMPVYLNSLGFNQSDIGRVHLLFGLLFICFMQSIAHLIDKSNNAKLFIVVTGLAGICGLGSFIFLPGISAIVVSVVLLSITSMCSQNSHYAYLMNSREVRNIGEGPAYSIYSTLFSIGQTMGPLLIGCFITQAGYKGGIVEACIFYIIVIMLFYIITRSIRTPVTEESQ